MIDMTEVVTTYNGRTGCACGCGGSYATSGQAAARRVNLINSNLKDVEFFKGFDGETIAELVSPNGERVTRVYYKEGALA